MLSQAVFVVVRRRGVRLRGTLVVPTAIPLPVYERSLMDKCEVPMISGIRPCGLTAIPTDRCDACGVAVCGAHRLVAQSTGTTFCIACYAFQYVASTPFAARMRVVLQERAVSHGDGTTLANAIESVERLIAEYRASLSAIRAGDARASADQETIDSIAV